MTIRTDDSVLQLALAKGWLSSEQAESARATVEAGSGEGARERKLADLLVAKRLLTPRQVAALLAEELGLATVDLRAVDVPGELCRLVPRTLARVYPRLDGQGIEISVDFNTNYVMPPNNV